MHMPHTGIYAMPSKYQQRFGWFQCRTIRHNETIITTHE